MSKHTPGPWRLADHGEIVGATRRIAYMQPFGANQMLGGEGIANARLISAAPELLEALKWIFSEGFYNEDGDFLIRCVPWDGKTNPPDTSDPQVLTFARAAIAKAKGTE